MTENVDGMMKKLMDALANDSSSVQEVTDLCNQILVLNPDNPNARVMKASLLMYQYEDSKFEESGLEDYEDDSLVEVGKKAIEVVELLTGITRPNEITEEIKNNFSSTYATFLDEWGRQSLKHGSHSRNVLQRKHSESLIVAIMCWFPSRIEREQNKKMKLFLEQISQFSWLQNYPDFFENFRFLFKSRTVDYKIYKNAAKILIKAHKGIDKKSDLGVAVRKFKRAFMIRKNRKLIILILFVLIVGILGSIL